MADEKNETAMSAPAPEPMPTPPAKVVCIADPPHGIISGPEKSRIIETKSSNGGSTQKPKGHRRNYTLDVEAQITLPDDPDRKRFSRARYVIFTVYRRLFTLVFCANFACFLYVMISDRQLLALVNATAVNLVACGLARHPMVVNAIYRIVCSLPRSSPLWLRRTAAKAAHYGGVHSGCGVASLVWYIGFVAMVSQTYFTSSPISPLTAIQFSAAPIVIAYIILVLLLVMVIVAYPAIRRKFHDYFEFTHRFTSWLILALFVVLVMVFAHEASAAQNDTLGHYLINLPAFWLLMAAVLAVAHPWLLLRKVPVHAESLSTHAVRLHFNHTAISFAKGVQVTKHPLRDWHSFAGFPDPDPTGKNNMKSWSIVVSKAGDWTADTISNPPTYLWKRGALMRGVGYGLRLFNRIIIVTTGSGIGPCLGFLGDENRPAIKVIWQTRTPVKTYGQDVVDLVHKMGPDPIIWDTSTDGRIDMIPLVRQQVQEFQAEAVFVISNPSMTQQIVYEFESQGIPAYGPIFDS